MVPSKRTPPGLGMEYGGVGIQFGSEGSGFRASGHLVARSL